MIEGIPALIATVVVLCLILWAIYYLGRQIGKKDERLKSYDEWARLLEKKNEAIRRVSEKYDKLGKKLSAHNIDYSDVDGLQRHHPSDVSKAGTPSSSKEVVGSDGESQAEARRFQD